MAITAAPSRTWPPLVDDEYVTWAGYAAVSDGPLVGRAGPRMRARLPMALPTLRRAAILRRCAMISGIDSSDAPPQTLEDHSTPDALECRAVQSQGLATRWLYRTKSEAVEVAKKGAHRFVLPPVEAWVSGELRQLSPGRPIGSASYAIASL